MERGEQLMATVSKWTPFGVALNITATAATVTRTSATKYTVRINASWATYYSGAQTNYGMAVSSGGVGIDINDFGTKASSGSGTFTGTYSITGNGSGTKTITVTFRNFNDDNGDSATKTVSFTVTVPAWTSYVITYNANGGSGAPSSQTKWKDQTLILSSIKPTRTGYSFMGWSTSSSATSATYSAGGSYTTNAAATLYAVWKANTYTVKFNANGGSGAPGNQTKTYGKTLTLSSTKPTRTNYTFKGWGTSASATTVAYAAGGSYTANAAITLYAIWELSYVKPKIYNVSIQRCNSSGDTTATSGYNGLVSFEWETTYVVSVITIEWKKSTDTTWSSTTLDTNATTTGHEEVVVDQYNGLSSNYAYDIRITVTDSGGSSYATGSLLSVVMPIDLLGGGNGIAFGKTAELENTAEFAFEGKFNKPVYGKALGMDKLPEIPANSDFNNYMDPGCYAVYRNDNAATISNIPVARAGRLEVWSSTGEGVRSSQWSYLRQRFVPYNNANAVWERDISRSSDNVWSYGDWWRSTLTPAASEFLYREPQILWGASLTSGMYMTESHTIGLLEPVSEQRHGIILVFCAYNGSSDTNYSWQSFFVPKQLVALSSSGHTFVLGRGKFTYTGTKYLYINDTTITGHADNNLTGTNNGITYANNKFVLRYVIGV